VVHLQFAADVQGTHIGQICIIFEIERKEEDVVDEKIGGVGGKDLYLSEPVVVKAH
jgi:hypothetical protein